MRASKPPTCRSQLPDPHSPRAPQRAIPVRMRALTPILFALAVHAAAGVCAAQTPRPTVGVAFGGGSARVIAHIGVIQWFEENHIPIDIAAGTSMGGLVGGSFASGMSAAELRTLITGTDWDLMFGASSFPFKNLRRK